MKKLDDRFSYTIEVDINGRPFFTLWDFSNMHGRGVLRSPTCVYETYDMADMLRKVGQITNSL